MESLHSLGYDDQNDMQHDFFGQVKLLPSDHITPKASSMAHDTDSITGASSSIRSQTGPLNNHINMTNPMVSLMLPSASCDRNFCHVHAKN